MRGFPNLVISSLSTILRGGRIEFLGAGDGVMGDVSRQWLQRMMLDAGLYAPLCGDDNLQRWEVVGQLLDQLLGETSSKISYFCTLNEKLMLFFSLGRPRTPVVL